MTGGGSPTRLRFRSLSPRRTGIECRGGDLVITGSELSAPLVVPRSDCLAYAFPAASDLPWWPDHDLARVPSRLRPNHRWGVGRNVVLVLKSPRPAPPLRPLWLPTLNMQSTDLRSTVADDAPIDALEFGASPRRAVAFFDGVGVPLRDLYEAFDEAVGTVPLPGARSPSPEDRAAYDSAVVRYRRSRWRLRAVAAAVELAALAMTVRMAHTAPNNSGAASVVVSVIVVFVPIVVLPFELTTFARWRTRRLVNRAHA